MNPYVYAPSTDTQMIQDVAKAVNGEYSAISCYSQLAQKASSEKEKHRILEIRQDEVRHYQTFYTIYTNLTGRQPTTQITEACPTDFVEGLKFSVEDEQKTVDFYQEIADKSFDSYIKEQFRRAATDEQNHAVWFLYFFTKHCCGFK